MLDFYATNSKRERGRSTRGGTRTGDWKGFVGLKSKQGRDGGCVLAGDEKEGELERGLNSERY